MRSCSICLMMMLTVAACQPARFAAADNQFPLFRMPPMKTLGGRQFWGDVHYRNGWRIQQHVLTKHYRLLDPDDRRHASGKQDACLAALNRIAAQRNFPQMSGKAVVLVHGILRSSKSFDKLTQRLQAAGYTVVPFDYPSTQVHVHDSAGYLRATLKSLQGIDEIHFVVHSMGGLVVRAYLKEKPDPRIKRMVMLGVPNHGAEMADLFKKNPLFRVIFGPAGKQLAVTAEFAQSLPIPEFPFGVIAGIRGKANGYNPLIPGEDDGTVTVDSTRLPGAADFATVKCLHSFLSSNPTVGEYVLNFLKLGRFRSEGPPQPIAPRPQAENVSENPGEPPPPAVAQRPVNAP